ncbi:major histocompatibility complex class I-related gene protein-like isoform X2 [Hemicordylus capensis]|uniref:major histocompatibility complex class I-related gene protein-like isoform X2 n=1 Tax=Hemicordylus capensis TaxID=884348 RepID=UPI0023040DD8|nr:major histocompatibility complex class I-related gene protein-like isoform X2 [Hemicordylus capensis]
MMSLCSETESLPGQPRVLLLGRGSVTHSLLYIYTSILEPGQEQPNFFSVANLDGYLASFYDSNTRRIVPRASWMKNLEEDSPDDWGLLTQRALIGELRFKGNLMNLQKYYNQSAGLHILQRVIGCELPEDGRRVGYHQYGYNGRDFISFDKETLTWTAADTQAQMAQRKLDTDLARSRNIKFWEENQCIEELQKFLEYGKGALSKNEPPVVKVRRKAGYDGWETLICRLYGFYPKEIDATWRKDGEVWEQDTFRGFVSPNSDGTYHTWLSIQIDPKERDHFRCHVEHDGLPEPLDLAWEESATGWSRVGVILGVILGILAVLLAVGIIFYFKIPQGGYITSTSGEPKSVPWMILKKLKLNPHQVDSVHTSCHQLVWWLHRDGPSRLLPRDCGMRSLLRYDPPHLWQFSENT